MTTVTNLASQSLFVIITGAVNTGKSYQITSLLTAHVDGEPVATPTLFLLAEASGEGTAAEVLNDPGLCCVWPVADCDEAIEALQECFSKAGPVTLGEAKRRWHKVACRRVADENLRALAEDKSARPMDPPPPLASSPRDGIVLRSVVVDTGTSLYQGSINTYVRNSMAEAEKKQKGSSKDRSGKKDAPWNNSMNTNAFAAARFQAFTDRLNAVTQHTRGLIALVTVHTRPSVRLMAAEGGEKQQVVVGETPALGATKIGDVGLAANGYSATWSILAGKANVIWHCFDDVPDLSNVATDDLNAPTTKRVTYGVITDKCKTAKRGVVDWVKRQGGEGPWSIFDSLPMYWHPNVKCDPATAAFSPTPNIGKVVAFALKAARSAA